MNQEIIATGGTWARRSLALVALAGALFATAASSDDDEASDTNDSSGEASGGTQGADGGTSDAEAYAVGDLVEIGVWEVRVHGMTDPYTGGNEFLPPADGMRYVAVDTEVTNISDESQVMSSLMCFEVLDSADAAYPMTLTDLEIGPLDAEAIEAGGSRRATVTYEVPVNAAGLRFKFACDPDSDASAIISLG